MQNRGALAPPSVDIPPELAAMSYDQILALLNAQQGALQAPGFNDGGDAGGDGGEGGEGEGGDEGGGSESGDADEGGEGVAGDMGDDDGQGGGEKGGEITSGEVLGGEIAAAEADIAAAAAAAAAAANAPGPAMGALSGFSVSDFQNAQALGEMNTGRSAQQGALSSDLFGDFDLSVPATQQTVTAEIPSELRGDLEVSVPATMAPAAPVATPAVQERGGLLGAFDRSNIGQIVSALERGDYEEAAGRGARGGITAAMGPVGLAVSLASMAISSLAEAITGQKGTPTPGNEEGSVPGQPGHGDEAYPVDPGAGQGAFTPATTDPAASQNWLNTWMQGTPGYQAAANGGALGYANGGKVPAGSHVIPADVVAAKGNGSSRAGALTYKPLGGRLVNGSGNGRSDSVPAKGPQGALRLSRDEVVVPPRGVRQAGGHGALSADSMQTRQKFQQHLGALPPPRGSREPARRNGGAFADGGETDGKRRRGTTGEMRALYADPTLEAGAYEPQGPTWSDLAEQYGPAVAETILSVLPGSGEVMSALDSGRLTRQAIDSFGRGDYKAMVSDGAGALAAGLGAIPLVGAVARGARGAGKAIAALPMDGASRMARAKEIGYNTPLAQGALNGAEDTAAIARGGDGALGPAAARSAGDAPAGGAALRGERGGSDGAELPGLTDEFGNALTARHIAGVREAGGPDVALDFAAVQDLANRLTGGKVSEVAKSGKPLYGNPGTIIERRGPDGPTAEIYIDKALSSERKAGSYQHETGHAVDFIGTLTRYSPPPPAVIDDMRRLSKMARPDMWRDKTPSVQKYLKSTEELTADAVKMYFADPALTKSVSGTFAKWLRETANKNPRLREWIQFNEMAAATGAAGVGAGALSMMSPDAEAAPR